MQRPSDREARGAGRLRLRALIVIAIAASVVSFAAQVRADDEKKPDPWCKVLEEQLKRNDEESQKPHSPDQVQRLREERERLEQDWNNRNCDG